MTPSGIKPATFRFVAQHRNHCATMYVVQNQHMFSSSQLDVSTISKTFIVFVPKAVQLDMYPFYTILVRSAEILVLNAAMCLLVFHVCQPGDDRI